MAYPTAFLISPEKVKNEKLKIFDSSKSQQNSAKKNLRKITVLTNLDIRDLGQAMRFVNNCKICAPQTYIFENGLEVHWILENNQLKAEVSGCNDSEQLQQYGEQYFKRLDTILGRNIRDIRSRETFYYTYETSYTDARDIYDALKEQNAREIYMSQDETIVTAKVEGDNIKYYKQDTNFMLEVEKRISVVNIGINEDTQRTFRQSPLQSVKVQTNIAAYELADLLQKSGYRYMRASGDTPLKTTYSTLNWRLEDGKYFAEFSGLNEKALNSEIEQIFRNMNKVAGRDLRLINKKSSVTYKYKTNYTDRGILINTLLEHGASNLEESSDKISCRLFDMDMVYLMQDGAFMLEITRVSDVNECESLMNDLNDEYGLNIQEMTYKKIKERLSQENMRLEDETVLADNSIVLTIDVG